MKETVAGLSHDLRTPLTALIGYLDLLEQEENGETVRRYLSQIRNRTEALKDLTEELFQYSVAASSQELHPEPVDVVGALEESLLSFYGVMQEKVDGLEDGEHLVARLDELAGEELAHVRLLTDVMCHLGSDPK